MFNKQLRTIVAKTMCDASTIKNALKIALIVGIVLNIINQGDYIFNMMFDHINYYKMGLTFCVPFGVSTYTAIAINMRFKIGEKAIIDTKLTCKKCGSVIHVKEGQIIPECPRCGLNCVWKVTK